MDVQEYSLVHIIRDPGIGIYEAYELSREGHYYLYRYDAGEEVFYRATVPAGAAAVQFFPLKPTDTVPLGGWYRVEKRSLLKFKPKVITSRKPPLSPLHDLTTGSRRKARAEGLSFGMTP